MLPRRLMLCIENLEEAAAYKGAVGALARRLGAGLVLYHASRPRRAEVGKDPVPDPAWFDALIGDPAFAGIDVSTHHSKTPFDFLADIEEAAKAEKADWLVMPTHARKGFDRLLLGSFTERAIRSCRWPVLALEMAGLHDPGDVAFDQVIVPVDFSKIAEASVPVAAELADRWKCGLTLVHVVEDYYTTAYPLTDLPFLMEYRPRLVESSRRQLEALAGRLGSSGGTAVRVVVEPGTLVQVMEDTAAAFRRPLFVISTSGRTSLSAWVLGSRAERMLRALHGSVLALPHGALDAAKP